MVQAETGFPPEEEALSDLERAFTVNQYKAAMQLLRLTAPNPSSHVGIPSHVGDPTRKAVQVDKAHAIFDEMKDHQAMGMTMRVGAGQNPQQISMTGLKQPTPSQSLSHPILSECAIVIGSRLAMGMAITVGVGRKSSSQIGASVFRCMHPFMRS